MLKTAKDRTVFEQNCYLFTILGGGFLVVYDLTGKLWKVDTNFKVWFDMTRIKECGARGANLC